MQVIEDDGREAVSTIGRQGKFFKLCTGSITKYFFVSLVKQNLLRTSPIVILLSGLQTVEANLMESVAANDLPVEKSTCPLQV